MEKIGKRAREEEGLETDRNVTHGLAAAVNTQVGVGEGRGVSHSDLLHGFH